METPVVRYFVACRQIDVDPARRHVSLQRLVYKIVRLPGEPFPCICEPFALFALLTNGRGTHELGVELAYFGSGEESTIWHSPNRSVDLGPDPTVVHGLPIPLRNVIFERAGQYTFHLLCNGQRLTQAEVEVS